MHLHINYLVRSNVVYIAVCIHSEHECFSKYLEVFRTYFKQCTEASYKTQTSRFISERCHNDTWSFEPLMDSKIVQVVKQCIGTKLTFRTEISTGCNCILAMVSFSVKRQTLRTAASRRNVNPRTGYVLPTFTRSSELPGEVLLTSITCSINKCNVQTVYCAFCKQPLRNYILSAHVWIYAIQKI